MNPIMAYEVWATPARVDAESGQVRHDLDSELVAELRDKQAAVALAQTYQDEHPLTLVFVVGSDARGLHVH